MSKDGWRGIRGLCVFIGFIAFTIAFFSQGDPPMPPITWTYGPDDPMGAPAIVILFICVFVWFKATEKING